MKIQVAILLICSGCALAQYGADNDAGGGGSPILPKKSLQIPRRIKQQTARLASPTSQTAIINQRFRRPIPINKPRPASNEPIPELPVFTSGIRGSRPSSLTSALNYEQSDDASAIPIQTIQQPHIVHAQSVPAHEFKPVSEENEKDEDVVQVIANLGAVSAFGAQGNLLTPTAAPIIMPSSTISSFLQQQQERQQQQNEHHQQEVDRQQLQVDRHQQQVDKQHQQIDRQHHQQQQLVERQHHQQFERQQPGIQYRPQILRSTPTYVPEQQLHQVITPVQYRPQKPVKLQKQQIAERNEYDLNEARPVKQRTQSPPKKSKGDYYEGRTKKPVAQVIRRYREETADGSIIWGFENDDGSFKEEMIGIDCITRGKYGYVDPDGLRREYTYETGIKCDGDPQKQQDQDILNTFVDYQENKLVLPSGKTIDLSSMGKKQARRPPHSYRN